MNEQQNSKHETRQSQSGEVGRGRTESIVIQVAPNYENDKIKEMEMFGWDMHGRQEIHEEGDAYGRPSFISDSTYVTKTKVSHYVKLHFIRQHNLPNIDKIKQIESEYFSVPFPLPPSTLSFIMSAFFIFCGLVGLVQFGTKLLGSTMLFLCGGGWWLFSNIKKQRKNRILREKGAEKQAELITKLQPFI